MKTNFCITFTTIPSRLNSIHKTIESIERQTLKPKKITTKGISIGADRLTKNNNFFGFAVRYGNDDVDIKGGKRKRDRPKAILASPRYSLRYIINTLKFCPSETRAFLFVKVVHGYFGNMLLFCTYSMII